MKNKDREKLIVEIYHANQMGAVTLWRGMPKYEIDYQVSEVIEANRRKREWCLIMAGEE